MRLFSHEEYLELTDRFSDCDLTNEQEESLIAMMISDIRAENGYSVPDPHRGESSTDRMRRGIAETIARFEAPLVSIADGWVTITTHGADPSYEFSLSRCDTPERLIGWVHQLSHKMWVTRDHIDSLVCTIANHFGWSLSV